MDGREHGSSVGRVIFWAGSYLQVCSGYGNDSRQNEPLGFAPAGSAGISQLSPDRAAR